MSKIELTEQQTERLRKVWLVETTHAKALVAVANELVAMGLVRPATDDLAQRADEAVWDAIEDRVKANDDLAARVAALEAYINGDEPGVPPNVRTPDPHAAAKGEFQKALDRVDARAEKIVADIPPSQRAIISQSEAKPRTDADRLEMLAKVAYEKMKHEGPGVKPEWHPGGNSFKQDEAREIALAVRKADRAGQLEPSEEECSVAYEAYCTTEDEKGGWPAIKNALIAAARVRLEKAEGEQP